MKLLVLFLVACLGCGGVAQNGLDPSPNRFDRATGKAFDRLGVPNAVEDGSTAPTHDRVNP